jgi:hypothetical protein
MMKKLYLFLMSMALLPFMVSGQYKIEETLLISYNDYLYSQALDSLNSQYIATGYMDISNKTLGKDILLVKWKDTPGYIWVKHYSGPGNRYDVGRHVMKTQDGGYLVSGTTNSYSGGVNYDGFTMKLNLAGTVQWFNYYGGSYADCTFSSCEDSNYYYVTGQYGLSAIVINNTNGFIYCFNKTTGAMVWGKRYKNYNNAYYLSFKSIIVGYDGNLIVTGTGTASTSTCIVCIKVNPSNGNLIWNNRYTISGKKLSSVNIAKGYNNGYILTGVYNVSAQNKVMLLKIRGDGSVSWAKNFYRSSTDDDGVQSIKTNNGYAVYGVTKSFGSDDLFLLNTDTSGYMINLHYYHGPSSTEGSLLFHDVGTGLLYLGNDGYAMVSGQKDGSNYWNSYLLRTNINGYTGCELDSAFSDSTLAVSCRSLNDSLFNITVNDSTVTEYNIYPSWDTICEPDSIDSNSYKTLKLDQKIDEGNIKVYPNPATSSIYIDFGEMNPSDAEVNIYDYTGHLVMSKLFNQSAVKTQQLDVSRFSKGLYILQVKGEKVHFITKIVVE